MENSNHINIYRSILEPIRKNLPFDERLNGYDKGLILAWEVGRQTAITNPDIANRVNNGELPQLNHKGGHAKKLKSSDFKYGTFHYLAEIQGILGKDLDIDYARDDGFVLVCSRTRMKTIFTSEQNKYKKS